MTSSAAIAIDDWLTGRASRLANSLRQLGLLPGEPVSVLVCDRHEDDRSVAIRAAVACHALPIRLDVGEDLATLAMRLSELRGGLLLACAEGVEVWRNTRVPMRTIGDHNDVLWWKALEAAGGMRNGFKEPVTVPTSVTRCDLEIQAI